MVVSVVAAPLLKTSESQAASRLKNAAICQKETGGETQSYMRCLNRESVEGMVYRAYQTVLGREPDTGGFNYWVSVANGAVAKNQDPTRLVVTKMMGSLEYGNKYMTENTQVWVQELYQRALFRKAAASEVNYWVGQINNRKQTHQQVAAFFTQSDEQMRLTAWNVPCYVAGENSQYCFDH